MPTKISKWSGYQCFQFYSILTSKMTTIRKCLKVCNYKMNTSVMEVWIYQGLLQCCLIMSKMRVKPIPYPMMRYQWDMMTYNPYWQLFSLTYYHWWLETNTTKALSPMMMVMQRLMINTMQKCKMSLLLSSKSFTLALEKVECTLSARD